MNRLFLSHLLPYDPGVKNQERLKDGLNEYLLLLVIAEEAIHAFIKRDLNNFDPLVGENSCQIRALKIALIASKENVIVQPVLDKIAFSKKHIHKLLEKVDQPSISENSLKHFLESLNIDIELCCDFDFLIKSYILTKTKFTYGSNEIIKFYKNEKTQAKLIRELGNVGSRFADDLVRRVRELLSKNSAEFVLEISRSPYFKDEKISDIIKNFSICYRGLSCTPFYWMTKLIMYQAIISKIPIVVVAQQFAKDLEYEVLNKTTLFFRAIDLEYHQIDRQVFNPDDPIVVFKVASCRNSSDFPDKKAWERELIEENVVDLILACNAAHRQYPDPSQDYRILEIKDESYKYYLEKSEQWGCSLKNPSRFFVTHVYCDNIKNI